MNKLITCILIIFVLLVSLIPITSYAQNSDAPTKNVKIMFDNKNATVTISVNNTQYFSLKFMRLYVGSSSMLSSKIIGSGDMDHMHIRTINLYNNFMGNYTKIIMWKSFSIKNKMHHTNREKNNFNINISFEFYITEKTYKKKNITITKNMIRYDTKIFTNIKNYYIFLEERLNYANSKNHTSRVFECNKTRTHWKVMRPTAHITTHRFGYDHIGMVGFGRNNVTFRYLWQYQKNLDTFYSYDGSQFILYFGFMNDNGTIIQDPYISLPLDITGNVVSLVHEVKHVVNYVMDHALSFGIGLIIAVVVIFSAPILKRRRL